MTLRDVTNSSAQNICIYCYWLRFLLYGPYIRAVYTARIYIWALGTHYPYIRAVQPKSIASNTFLYGPYIRAVYTGDRYALPVHTARTYGPYVRAVCTGVKNAPVDTGRKYGPYIYGCSVHTTHIELLFCTGRIYGRIYGCQNTPVCTGRKYGPYIRAVFTGSAYRPLAAPPLNTFAMSEVSCCVLCSTGRQTSKVGKRMWFFNVGLSGKDGTQRKTWEVRTLETLLKENKHMNVSKLLLILLFVQLIYCA